MVRTNDERVVESRCIRGGRGEVEIHKILNGVEELYGVTVSAKDLRAGAALIIAGLAARGTTWVKNVHYVERGYERLIEKFTALGAQIRRIED